jgi:hypothetical protein
VAVSAGLFGRLAGNSGQAVHIRLKFAATDFADGAKIVTTRAARGNDGRRKKIMGEA